MNHSIYGEIYSESYDSDSPETGSRKHPLLAFYLSRWEQAGKPAPVLEPMCGTGFSLIPFLEEGADIDGLDASPYMLSECRKKCSAKGLHPTLHQQLIEDLALPRRYRFIFIPDRSIAHIYDKEVAQKCLGKIYEHLLPGGWFILDIKTPPRVAEFGKPGVTRVSVDDRRDGSTILCTTLWGEKEEGRVVRCVNKYERFVDGALVATELFDYHERLYDRDEFEKMLCSAGFLEVKVVEVTRTYEGCKPDEHDRIVFSCRRPE